MDFDSIHGGSSPSRATKLGRLHGRKGGVRHHRFGEPPNHPDRPKKREDPSGGDPEGPNSLRITLQCDLIHFKNLEHGRLLC